MDTIQCNRIQYNAIEYNTIPFPLPGLILGRDKILGEILSVDFGFERGLLVGVYSYQS
jgi:hypothetical protein